ncbi:Amidohydrolase 3 [Ignisphaera aggregans DSM 17230]|uniref:Amidohydrolase 3 n=1 Tax=Ignisphaera aggregans (strain DSM 17230 / JCM 13409 / AQ1.S1) TaxID=583356 RepID=E0SNG5_IGNAA|nr:Amidohydrolase 3 [Ignisphaera aggregans DSM 17230]
MGNIKCFLNGKIYVSYIPRRVVEAIAVANGRIIYAGSSRYVERICREFGGVSIDLNGRVVLPGFIDSHIHLTSLGLYLNALDLRGVRSIEEIKRLLYEYSRRVKTSWIFGHGWDQELFYERRLPTRWDIDEVVSDRPVVLTRTCLHVAVLNTRAMEITGLINSNIPGVIRDERGIPIGIVVKDALKHVFEYFMKTLSIEDYKKILIDAMRFLASYGITTVAFVNCDDISMKVLNMLNNENRVIIRIRLYLNPDRNIIEALKTIGVSLCSCNNMLRICGVKVIADGSLGARTAWLSKPYSDDPTTYGRQNIDEETLYLIAKEVNDIGLQLAVHGIGDRAIDMILDVYERLGDVRNRRHRIEHASLLRDDQIDRMARIGVVASVQPHFIISDWWAKDRVGERARWLYRFRSMIRKGIVIGFGSDAPVETPNPWETIYAAISRGRHEGITYYSDTQEEVLTIDEALHAYTYGSAYIINEEENLGTLEEGKLADFIVVDRDPFSVNEKEIRNIKVLETYIGGEKIYP